MIKRLLLCLALLCGLAAAQGGAYPLPSITFANVALNAPITGSIILPLPIATYGSGLIVTTFTSLGGAPANCSVGLVFGAVSSLTYQNGAVTNTNGNITTPALITTPGARFTRIVGGNLMPSVPVTAAALTWTCTTYPTSGSASIEFIPDTIPSNNYSHITTNTSTVLKQTAAVLQSITINQAGTTETITVFDNTACSGTVVAVLTGFATGQQFTYGAPSTSGGLCILTAGTTPGDYTVAYR